MIASIIVHEIYFWGVFEGDAIGVGDSEAREYIRRSLKFTVTAVFPEERQNTPSQP